MAGAPAPLHTLIGVVRRRYQRGDNLATLGDNGTCFALSLYKIAHAIADPNRYTHVMSLTIILVWP